MFLVMSFTGKQAAEIKEAYIDAFNLMHERLFPKTQYGLKQFQEPPTVTKAQLGVLFNRVKTIASGSGKIRAELWSRFQNHFKLNSYKELPYDKFDEATAYLDAKQEEYNGGVEIFCISDKELESKVAERVRALEGEVLPKQEAQHNSITVTLAPLSNGEMKRYLITHHGDNMVQLWAVTPDTGVRTREHFIRELKTDGYVVAERTAYGVRSMVMDFLPIQVMPVIIEAAMTRVQRCNWQMPESS